MRWNAELEELLEELLEDTIGNCLPWIGFMLGDRAFPWDLNGTWDFLCFTLGIDIDIRNEQTQ